MDVGCGKGLKIKYLRSLGYDTYGFDISEIAINEANTVNAFVGDISRVAELEQIEGIRFSLILDFAASQFVSNREKYVKFLPELLNYNGYFVLTQFCPAQESPAAIQKLARTATQIEEEFEKFNILETIVNKDKYKPSATYIMKKA